MKTIKSVYKIGNGPSSSHTVGPVHAAQVFGGRYPDADAYRVTLFGSLALYGKKRWLTVIGIVIPFLCGISRFCLGLHYPTDVLAGWACGVIVIFLVPYLEKKLMKRYFYAILLVISLSGFLYCQSDDYFSAVGLLVGFILAVVTVVIYFFVLNT